MLCWEKNGRKLEAARYVCICVPNVGCQWGALTFTFCILPSVYTEWMSIICIFKMYRKLKYIYI